MVEQRLRGHTRVPEIDRYPGYIEADTLQHWTHNVFTKMDLDAGKIFKPGKLDAKGVRHFELTKEEGHQAATDLFSSFQNLSQDLNIVQRAETIKRISFDQLGFNAQQQETLRRSLRANLMVWAAKKYKPEANPWKTIQEIKGKEKTSVFTAFDQALAKATQDKVDEITKVVSAEEQKDVRHHWKSLVPELTRKDRIRNVVNAGAVAAWLALVLGGGWQVSAAMPRVDEKGRPPSPDAGEPREMSREEILDLVPSTSQYEGQTASIVTPEPPTPSQQKGQIFTGDEGRVESVPESFNYLELAVGNKLTFSSEALAEPLTVTLVEMPEFNRPNLHSAVFGGRYRIELGDQSKNVSLQLHSSRKGKDILPGQQLLEAIVAGKIRPGTKLTITNETTKQTINLVFLGLSRGLQAIKNEEYTDEEWQTGLQGEVERAVDNLAQQTQGFDSLTRAVKARGNTVTIVTCATLNEEDLVRNPEGEIEEFLSKYVMVLLVVDSHGETKLPSSVQSFAATDNQ